jgi:hypothetical protein
MTQSEPTTTSVTPALRRKIPISLSVVSYFFFAIGLIEIIRGVTAIPVLTDDLPPLRILSLASGVLLSFALGTVYLFLSRGLRRCARGWHICALVVVSGGLILTIYRLTNYFLSHPADLTGTLPYRFLLALILGVLFQVWIFHILTRADIRRLFYGGHDHAA